MIGQTLLHYQILEKRLEGGIRVPDRGRNSCNPEVIPLVCAHWTLGGLSFHYRSVMGAAVHFDGNAGFRP
jgi:hypothetical protein